MANFIKIFDCKNEDHVLWLKKIGGVMAKSMTGEKINVEAAINDNPYPVVQKSLMWLIGPMYISSFR